MIILKDFYMNLQLTKLKRAHWKLIITLKVFIKEVVRGFTPLF